MLRPGLTGVPHRSIVIIHVTGQEFRVGGTARVCQRRFWEFPPFQISTTSLLPPTLFSQQPLPYVPDTPATHRIYEETLSKRATHLTSENWHNDNQIGKY